LVISVHYFIFSASELAAYAVFHPSALTQIKKSITSIKSQKIMRLV